MIAETLKPGGELELRTYDPHRVEIQTSETVAKLIRAMIDAGKGLKSVSKSGWNNHFSYTYATLEDYCKTLRDAMAEHGLVIVGSVAETIDVPIASAPDAKKKPDRIVRVMLTQRLIHESGEWLEMHVAGEGADPSDKAAYKAITGARKYALACLWNLATTDDPEYDGGNGDAAPPANGNRPTPRAANGNGNGGNGNGSARKPDSSQADLLARARELHGKLTREQRAAIADKIGLGNGRLSEQAPPMVQAFCDEAENVLGM